MTLDHVKPRQSIGTEDNEFLFQNSETCCMCSEPADIWVESELYCEFHATLLEMED